MSFPRYPKYKDSGVEWLGQVPAHWSTGKLKHGYAIVGGSTPKSDQAEYWGGDVAWVTPADLSRLGALEIRDSIRKITQQGLLSCGTTIVPSGSVILSTRAPIGSLGIAATELCTNQGCKALVPTDSQSSRYCAYVLSVSTTELNIRGKGTTFLELSGDELGAFPVALPPREEQSAIATFLDRETGKIDTLAAEYEHLIDLLKEKRQAVISHAVTKGLDPKVTMKDSGVGWLGDVPAHWGVTPMKYLVRLQSGGTPSKSCLAYWDGEVPWASAKDMKVDRLSDTEDHITELAIEEGAASLVPDGAVVVVVRGMILARMFPVAIALRQIAINQDLKAVMCGQQLRPEFFAWYLRGTAEESLSRLDEAGHGTKALRMDAWVSLDVALPPLAEQEAIAKYIGVATLRFDALMAEAEKAIDLLKERRSALISAAVTGKIDVRGLDAQRKELKCA